MKTYFFDIDGVIYDNHQMNNSVLRVLKEKQMNYYFCSGRGYRRTMDVVGNYITDNSLLIIENGSKIVDKNGNLIDCKKITMKEKQLVLKILNFIKKKDIDSIVFNPTTSLDYIVYKSKNIKYSSKIIQLFSVFQTEILKSNMTQITFLFKTDKIKEQFFELCLKHNINAYKSENYIIVNHEKVNKKTGINKIIENQKLKLSDICVVGNDYNDIPMFEIDCSKKIAISSKCLPKKLKELATNLSTFDDLYKNIE